MAKNKGMSPSLCGSTSHNPLFADMSGVDGILSARRPFQNFKREGQRMKKQIKKLKAKCEALDKEITDIRNLRMLHIRTLERGLTQDIPGLEKQVTEMAVRINVEDIKLSRMVRELSEISNDEVYPDFHKS